MDKLLEARRLLEEAQAELEAAIAADKARLEQVSAALAAFDVIEEAAHEDPGPTPAPEAAPDPVAASVPLRERAAGEPGPRQSAIDYEAVAEVIKGSRAAGRPVVIDLMSTFGVPKSTAKNWMVRCRDLRLLDPPPIQGTAAVTVSTSSPASSTVFITTPSPAPVVPTLVQQELEHDGEITPPRLAVVPEKHRAGDGLSADRPLNPARYSHVFMCAEDDCGFECDESKPLAMKAHTFEQHSRKASADEMTSLPKVG